MLPLFCEGNDVKIICGTEISENVKVTENTKKSFTSFHVRRTEKAIR